MGRCDACQPVPPFIYSTPPPLCVSVWSSLEEVRSVILPVISPPSLTGLRTYSALIVISIRPHTSYTESILQMITLETSSAESREYPGGPSRPIGPASSTEGTEPEILNTSAHGDDDHAGEGLMPGTYPLSRGEPDTLFSEVVRDALRSALSGDISSAREEPQLSGAVSVQAQSTEAQGLTRNGLHEDDCGGWVEVCRPEGKPLGGEEWTVLQHDGGHAP